MTSENDLLVIGAPLPGASGRRLWGDVVRELLDSPGNFPASGRGSFRANGARARRRRTRPMLPEAARD